MTRAAMNETGHRCPRCGGIYPCEKHCMACGGPWPCEKHGRFGASESSLRVMEQFTVDHADLLRRLGGK